MLQKLFKLCLLFIYFPVVLAQGSQLNAARVALAVGDVQIASPGHPARPLGSTQTVMVADRIITGSDAMAVLVFTDSARVALRANSELIIKRYTIDPSGAQTAMELELLRGTMRQISGQAAHTQPERYRLNTPVAAIGVRGTDFLTKVTGQTLEAYIQDGMIVLLPLSADATSLPLATLSSADAGRYAQILGLGAVERRTISPEDVDRIFGIRMQTPSTPEASLARPAPNTTPDHPNQVALAPAEPLQLAKLPQLATDTPAPPAPTPAAQPADTATATQPVTPKPTPSQPALVWGKFSDPLVLPFQLPVAYDDARQGRHVTVGQLGQFALWSEGPNTPLDKALVGRADFTLSAGEAFYQASAGAPAVPLTLSNPQLGVDFDRRTFSTTLSLSAAGVPSQQLQVNGSINDDGLLLGRAAGQLVAGALSHNVQEAGYLFSLQAGTSTSQGITLWTARQP